MIFLCRTIMLCRQITACWFFVRIGSDPHSTEDR
jgi:hypothetical protein